MKTHTSDFKNRIKEFGRELDSRVIYVENGEGIELTTEQVFSVNPSFEGSILKSTMRQLDIECNVDMPKNAPVNYQLGVKIRDDEILDTHGNYDWVNFGHYFVYKSEKLEDTNTYKITCYDKMINAMVDYVDMGITYPITVRDYINAICNYLGLTFKNINDTFANYNRIIPEERYLYEDGSSMGYTFRDVLDELAQVTASTICINEVDDKLEVRYINNTNDTIDEEYLKNVNVTFGKKYGPINTIVLSRSSDTDNVYYPSVLPENPFELKISDNQIMNFEDREDYLPDIYNKLNGLEYYINDFSSTGICYYNICDRYNVAIGENTYSCVMFNDDINVTQGLEENTHTEMPEQTVTEHKYSSEIEKAINKASIILNERIGEVDIRGKIINLEADNISITSPNFSVTPDGQITSTSGIIGGYKIGEHELYAETYAPYDFTNEDVQKINQYLADPTGHPLTPAEIELYDIDKDGRVTPTDMLKIDWYVSYGVTTTDSSKIIMKTGERPFDSAYVLKDGNDVERLNLNMQTGLTFDGMTFGSQDVLWRGAYYMNGNQSVDLSDSPISSQPHGIVLVWSAYENGSTEDWDWVCNFIPKEFVNVYGTGNGMLFNMATPTFGQVGAKYIYVSNKRLTGHANNTAIGTGSGITYKNNHWVLRYVIGV